MKVSPDAPTRPSIRYYGGKWMLAPWIIEHFPVHSSYVEPCGGAASVFLQKPRSDLEVYNDLWGHVVNFFRILRDQSDPLLEKIRLTPWARQEYDEHRILTDDPIENARRFWVGCCMSISGMAFTNSGWRVIKNPENAPNGIKSWLYLDQSHLKQAAERFYAVQIENRPWEEIVVDYDSPKTLIYFDPPYVHSTRSSKKEYAFEWDEEQHEKAANLVKSAKGYVVISGYACPLYTRLYEDYGWVRKDKEANTTGANRIESIWLSPNTIAALKQEELKRKNQFTLFDTIN